MSRVTRLVVDEILFWAGVLSAVLGAFSAAILVLSGEWLVAGAAVLLALLGWAIAGSSLDDIRAAAGIDSTSAPSADGTEVER